MNPKINIFRGLPLLNVQRLVKVNLWTFGLFLIFTTSLAAQFPGNNRNSGFGNADFSRRQASPPQELDPALDTLSKEVYFYYADNAAEQFLFQDSSMLNFHVYDPIRQAEYEHVHLGNLGSAHRQIVFQSRFHKGFDAGFHNYDLYLTRPEKIPYYNLEKAYSDIYFSQTNQERTAFNAKFSKPISKDTYLGIYYKNIRNEGQYTSQAARTNAFTANMNFQSKNKKYKGYLSFTTNTIEQKENGGGDVSNTADFRKGILAIGRPVNTSTGEARYFERDINYTQFYLLQKRPKTKSNPPIQVDTILQKIDSVKTSPAQRFRERSKFTNQAPTDNNIVQIPETGRKFTLKHNLSLRRNTYKYVDVNHLTYYGDFVKDDRGVRNYITTNQIENTFSIRTFRLEKEAKLGIAGSKIESKNAHQKDLIELGATHIHTNIEQEPLDSNVQNLFLFGKIHFTPSKRLKIKTYGHLGMFKQIGDYYLKGDFLWDTKKLGKINFSLISQLYSPSLLQRQFFVTQQLIWQNDFKKVFETSFSAKYSLPKLKIDLISNYHLIDNFIYNDTTQTPQQASTGLNIFQLILKNKIDIGRIHLENTAYFQQSTQSDILRFPQIYSIHRLYIDLKLFKVMETQLGTDVRLNTPYKPDNFQPLSTQFFLQDDYETKFHPTIDVFLNFRIQQFRFFFIYENIYDYFTTDFNYNTYPYPQLDAQARFGFRWLFLD